MARSREGLAVALALVAGCSVGAGEGRVDGTVRDVACRVDVPDYHMRPDFFSADVIEDRGALGGTARMLRIRIQRGSYRESDSDGLVFLVHDVDRIARESLGRPLPLGPAGAPRIDATLYLNETCTSGFPDRFWTVPSIVEVASGEITFESIYAPDLDPSNTEIRAHFSGEFLDPTAPLDRVARIEGEFDFFYQRGRPAQVFP